MMQDKPSPAMRAAKDSLCSKHTLQTWFFKCQTFYMFHLQCIMYKMRSAKASVGPYPTAHKTYQAVL